MKKWLTMGVLVAFTLGFVACQKDEGNDKRRGSKKHKSMAQSEQVIELEIEALSKN